MASNTKASSNIENAQYNGVEVMLHKVEHSILLKRFRSCSKLTIQVASSPATTGTWCVLSLPDNTAAVYRQVMFKPTLRDKESTIMKDCRLPGMLTPFSPPKKLDLCLMG
jgi:hypothetical protein